MGLFDAFRRSKERGVDEITDPAPRAQITGALRLAGIDGGGLTLPEPSGDLVEDLARLAALRRSGALTDEEFAAAKARLLSSQPPPGTPPSAA